MHDLVIANGLLFDSRVGELRPADVALTGARVSDISPHVDPSTAAQVLDVDGAIVAPGLVDLHAHVFSGQDLGLDADDVGPRSGTTTFVDAGSAGAHLWDALQFEIAHKSTRVLPFVNVATIGTTSIRLRGELSTPAYANVDACVTAMSETSHLPYGVKVRASGDVGGSHSDAALAVGRAIADRLGLPLMVHLGPAPSERDAILAVLRSGDVLTHCFTSYVENGLLDNGRVAATVWQARERGVLFDVGHGAAGFDLETAEGAMKDGFLPDTISSDLHAYSRDHVVDLPTVMSRFLALGLQVQDVLRRATWAPANALDMHHQGIGVLEVGGAADVAVLRVVDVADRFVDTRGRSYPMRRRFAVDHTIRAGRIVYQRASEGAA
ncbi:MAG TPA: amidohydrolase family protein [Acidothermaceae bacterium]|nr:amidohydrolase family protein [Acidothermaceae bacterium]